MTDEEKHVWSGGVMRPSRRLQQPPRSWRKDVGLYEKQCEASLSADVYRRKATADGTYSQATWEQFDGNHMRCPNPSKVMHRHTYRMELIGVCGVHEAYFQRHGAYFPYIPPGPHCSQPCCRGRNDD